MSDTCWHILIVIIFPTNEWSQRRGKDWGALHEHRHEGSDDKGYVTRQPRYVRDVGIQG